jgi:hypothetical protein
LVSFRRCCVFFLIIWCNNPCSTIFFMLHDLDGLPHLLLENALFMQLHVLRCSPSSQDVVYCICTICSCCPEANAEDTLQCTMRVCARFHQDTRTQSASSGWQRETARDLETPSSSSPRQHSRSVSKGLSASEPSSRLAISLHL